MAILSRMHVQRDRRAYRDHLLRVHGEVARRGSDVPVRLEGRELEVVWASVHRSRTSEKARAARRKEALGLPRVSDREAERRLKDNRARTARRHRAAARAREGALATLTAPEVPATADLLRATADDTRHVLLLGSTQADPPTVAPPDWTYSPCARCLNCSCREPKNYSGAQHTSPTPTRRSTNTLAVTNTSLFPTGSESTPSLPLTGNPPAAVRGPAGARRHAILGRGPGRV